MEISVGLKLILQQIRQGMYSDNLENFGRWFSTVAYTHHYADTQTYSQAPV